MRRVKRNVDTLRRHGVLEDSVGREVEEGSNRVPEHRGHVALVDVGNSTLLWLQKYIKKK